MRRRHFLYVASGILGGLAIGGGLALNYVNNLDPNRLFKAFQQLPIEEKTVILSELETKVLLPYDAVYDAINAAGNAPVYKFSDIKERLDQQTRQKLEEGNNPVNRTTFAYVSWLDLIVVPDEIEPDKLMHRLLPGTGYTRKCQLAHENLHRLQHSARKRFIGGTYTSEQILIDEIGALTASAEYRNGELIIHHTDIERRLKSESEGSLISRLFKECVVLYGYFSERSNNPDVLVAEFIGRNTRTIRDFENAVKQMIPTDEEFRHYSHRGFAFCEGRTRILDRVKEATKDYLRKRMSFWDLLTKSD